MLATPEDEKGERERKQGWGEEAGEQAMLEEEEEKQLRQGKKKKRRTLMTCAVHVLPLHTAKLHPFCTIIQSISAATQREEAAGATPIIQRVGRVEQ